MGEGRTRKRQQSTQGAVSQGYRSNPRRSPLPACVPGRSRVPRWCGRQGTWDHAGALKQRVSTRRIDPIWPPRLAFHPEPTPVRVPASVFFASDRRDAFEPIGARRLVVTRRRQRPADRLRPELRADRLQLQTWGDNGGAVEPPRRATASSSRETLVRASGPVALSVSSSLEN